MCIRFVFPARCIIPVANVLFIHHKFNFNSDRQIWTLIRWILNSFRKKLCRSQNFTTTWHKFMSSGHKDQNNHFRFHIRIRSAWIPPYKSIYCQGDAPAGLGSGVLSTSSCSQGINSRKLARWRRIVHIRFVTKTTNPFKIPKSRLKTCTSIFYCSLSSLYPELLSFGWGFFSGLSLFDIQSTEIFVGKNRRFYPNRSNSGLNSQRWLTSWETILYSDRCAI